jgi:hypothetical protein
MKYKIKKQINHYLREGDIVSVTGKSVACESEIPNIYMADAFYLFAAPDRRRIYFDRAEQKKKDKYNALEISWNEYYFKDIAGKTNSDNMVMYDDPPIPKKPCFRLQCWVNGKTFRVQEVGRFETFDLYGVEEFERMIGDSYNRILDGMKKSFFDKELQLILEKK